MTQTNDSSNLRLAKRIYALPVKRLAKTVFALRMKRLAKRIFALPMKSEPRPSGHADTGGKDIIHPAAYESKTVPIAIRLAVVSLVTVLCAGLALGGIEGSKHDFSSEKWADGDSCGVCHTPHREEPPTAAPLWDPDADLNRTFGTPITSSAEPGMGTLMCIRCHDGTIARDTIPIEPRGRFPNLRHPGLFGAGHGRSDHPVGVEYPNVQDGYHPANKVEASGEVRLPGGRVECITCHDPHDMSGQKYMLVMSNARSALCLTCHDK
jgi:predicted CXXCH cytochrome family protein